MLIDGQWQGDWQQRRRTADDGRFVREASTFRHWITPDGSPRPRGRGCRPA